MIIIVQPNKLSWMIFPVIFDTGFKCFPFNNFTYFLTPFSRFFSSFPHGTCSLSVSCLYLALDEDLPPILGCNPKQPDSLKNMSSPPEEGYTQSSLLNHIHRIFTFYDTPFHGILMK